MNMNRNCVLCGFIAVATLNLAIGYAAAQEGPTEDDYYRLTPLPIPEGVVLEAGDLEWMPDGRLAMSSRRGDIYMIHNPLAEDLDEIRFQRYAEGMHEVLGLAHRDGWLYATQRGEVTRIKDGNNDGTADVFETVYDGWGLSGDYHEYAFGSKFDPQGHLWVTLCLTGSFNSNVLFRGWCLRITPDGEAIPTCSGIRSPGGMGMNAAGDVFYTDNQGPWNGTCSLRHLAPGHFMGHPAGNRWYDHAPNLGEKPQEPESGSRIITEAAKIPQLLPPAILFPYKKMGQSAAGVACDTTGGKFGPFENQLFVADQTFSTVMRCYLEKVNGRYQGACFPFRSGFGSGALSVLMTESGTMFVGGTNRGWGSRGNKPYSLDRLTWTGKVPFEIKEMKARPDGFELVFTRPADRASAGKPESYKLQTYTYIYQASYGSPEVDHTSPTIKAIEVSDDGLHARLIVDGLQAGHVHELHAEGVRSADGLPLLHPQAYYTLNYIPER